MPQSSPKNVQMSKGKSQTTERVSIRMQDIPTQLLEKLVGDFLQKANETYRKTQGDIDIPALEVAPSNEEPIKKKARTLKTLHPPNASAEGVVIERSKYVDKQLEQYGRPLEGQYSVTNTRVTSDEPMADVLKLAVFQTMKASIANKYHESDFSSQETSVDLMCQWVSQYYNILTRRLIRLMEIQRRRSPNRDDLKLLEREGLFNAQGIHDMYDLSNGFSQPKNKKLIELIKTKAKEARTAYTGIDNGYFNGLPDEIFLEKESWLNQVDTRGNRKPYIPEWMPQLPPDYTYKSTPKYNHLVTDPVVLKSTLVKEGRLAEKALNHIIVKEENPLETFSDESISSSDDEEKEVVRSDDASIDVGVAQAQNTEKRLDNLLSNSMSSAESPHSDNDRDEKTEKEKQAERNDIVELARNRMAVLERRRKEEDERIKSRTQSEESILGRKFGLYSALKKLPDDIDHEMEEYRDRGLSGLIHNLHKQEKWFKKWEVEQRKLRKKQEEEKSKYQEANEIQINIGLDSATNFAIANIEEDVDFGVEFSDMEDYDESELKTDQQTAQHGEHNDGSVIGRSQNEVHEGSVRFQEQVEVISSKSEGSEGKDILMGDNVSATKTNEAVTEVAQSPDIFDSITRLPDISTKKELVTSKETIGKEGTVIASDSNGVKESFEVKETTDTVEDMDVEEDIDMDIFED